MGDIKWAYTYYKIARQQLSYLFETPDYSVAEALFGIVDVLLLCAKNIEFFTFTDPPCRNGVHSLWQGCTEEGYILCHSSYEHLQATRRIAFFCF